MTLETLILADVLVDSLVLLVLLFGVVAIRLQIQILGQSMMATAAAHEAQADTLKLLCEAFAEERGRPAHAVERQP